MLTSLIGSESGATTQVLERGESLLFVVVGKGLKWFKLFLDLWVTFLFVSDVFCNSLIGEFEDLVIVVGALLAGNGLPVCSF